MATRISCVAVPGDFDIKVRSAKGHRLRIQGTGESDDSVITGDSQMVGNPLLIALTKRFVEFTYAADVAEEVRADVVIDDVPPADEPDLDRLEVAVENDDVDSVKAKERRNAGKLAKSVVADIEQLTRYIDTIGEIEREGWCSACLERTMHRRVDSRSITARVWLCDSCGSPTTPCAVPGCASMATRKLRRQLPGPLLCAEHKHDVFSFDEGTATIADLDEYRTLCTYAKKDVSRASNVTVVGIVGAGAMASAAFYAAPAIGGVVGIKLLGLNGIAATNAGLAWLGGGSLASGGAGMAGGTMTIATGGTLIGGSLGASVVDEYYREDKSFRIEKVRDGDGPNVVIARGFTTEGSGDWREPILVAQEIYGDPTIYQVSWGSKALKDLTASLFSVGLGPALGTGMGMLGKRAAKNSVTKLGPLGAAVAVRELLANPWHVAHGRADKTGVLLARLLSRVEGGRFILMGHSLGARVMVSAALKLGDAGGEPIIDGMHLFGAAQARSGDWGTMCRSVSGTIDNYYSRDDRVLKYLYRAVALGKTPVGLEGFDTDQPKIVDHDLSAEVVRHLDYYSVMRTKLAANAD